MKVKGTFISDSVPGSTYLESYTRVLRPYILISLSLSLLPLYYVINRPMVTSVGPESGRTRRNFPVCPTWSLYRENTNSQTREVGTGKHKFGRRTERWSHEHNSFEGSEILFLDSDFSSLSYGLRTPPSTSRTYPWQGKERWHHSLSVSVPNFEKGSVL